MRWRMAAMAASVLAHAGLVAAFVIGLPQRDPPGAVDKGLQGIEVMLAAGGMAGAQAAEQPPPEPEKPVVAENPVEPPPPPPEPEPPVVTSKDTAPDLAEAPKPKPRPEEKPKLKPVVQKPRPRPPEPRPEPQQVQKPAETPPQEVKVAAVAAPAPKGQVGQQNAPGAGNGNARTSGGNPGAEANYFSMLSALLEGKKHYPWRAMRRGNEGVAYLQFSVARSGKIMAYSIRRSSGYSLLDEEVERMIRSADPLPPIPPEISKDPLDIIVPVEFFLKK